MSNTNEFLAGTDPTNSAAYPRIISVAISNGTDMAINYLGSDGDASYSGGPTTRTNVLDFATGVTGGGYTNDFASTGPGG